MLLQAALLAGAQSIDVLVDAGGAATHAMNPLYMGCHSDSGFVHEVRGWSSQMVYGESFETPGPKTKAGQASYAWQPVVSAALGKLATIALDANVTFAAQASQRISIQAAPPGVGGSAGLANRGLGNEGMYLQAGKEYEGYFFASSAEPVTLEARLETTDGRRVLAAQTIAHGGGAGFTQHKFSLTPSAGTECVGIEPGADPSVHCTANSPASHACIRCGGQFTVALVASSAAAQEVHLDYVVLQPGAWGRFAGLNARKDVADTLTRMGVKAIRLGGSFCSVTKNNGAYYQWQDWTGPVWQRKSVGAHWDSYGGDAYNLIGGWGPFEMIDYAVALGAEPIITTTETSTPESFADLVEYCWANATRPMGAKRIADGHAEPYKLRFIELGNEQYNSNYIAQVAAMEARAKEVGAAGELRYIFPSNDGVTGADVAAAAALGLGARLVTDVHVGAGGALPVAQALFAAHAAGGLTDDSAVNFETNAGSHDHGRALAEAADLNAFFSAGEQRVLARTASFCHGRAGHFDMFDQAISSFLPNATWLQPPGHVHAMVTATWQPHALNATLGDPGVKPSWATLPDKAITCSGSEYVGDLGTMSSGACLAALQKKGAANYAVWNPANNTNCYACAFTERGDPSTWQYHDQPGAVSFAGKNVLVPLSVSAQRSEDGATVVVRLVNNGAARNATVRLAGGWRATSATAVSMASDDLEAENTPADMDHVAPQPLRAVSVSSASTVEVSLPASSYSIIAIAGGKA